MPEGERNDLNPTTPAPSSAASDSRFSGTAPPQKPTSTASCPAAAARLAARASAVVVTGMLLCGMSSTVVTPDAAAAAVPVGNPSNSVGPGGSEDHTAARQ